jgi:hypothetical protein
MDVGDVEFDDWTLEQLQGIKDGEGRERVGCRVDDHPGSMIGGLMNPPDDCVLGIGLVEPQRPVSGRLPAHLLDLGEGRGSVDGRLSRAKTVEIGAIQHEDRFRHGMSFPIANQPS